MSTAHLFMQDCGLADEIAARKDEMAGFVSQYTNRLDAKGRVSIPAQFRAVLAKDGYEGLYCFPSPMQDAVDVGGNGLIEEINKRLEGYAPLTPDHDILSTALYGFSETLKIDRDGRVLLTESLKEYAGISNEITFVGQNYKFQMWNPQKFEAHRQEARERALSVLSGSLIPNKAKDAAN